MIKLRIVTPDGIFVNNKKCKQVNVQTIDGDMGILGKMAPFVSALKIGTLTFKEVGSNETIYVHLHRGILEVTSELCKVISERVYLVDEHNERIKGRETFLEYLSKNPLDLKGDIKNIKKDLKSEIKNLREKKRQ